MPIVRVAFALSLLALAACNVSRNPPAPAATTTAPSTSVTTGSDCGAVIARYRAVAKSDADTGNANASVYAQIDKEIRGAEAACAAGRDAEARTLIAGSKSRHGYPAGD